VDYKKLSPTLFVGAALFAAVGVSHYYGEEPITVQQKTAVITELDEQSLEELAKKDVVIFLYSKGCPACKQVEPAFRYTAEKYCEKVPFGQIDVSKYNNTLTKFNIPFHPSIVFIANGKQQEHTNSPPTEQELDEIIQMHYLMPQNINNTHHSQKL